MVFGDTELAKWLGTMFLANRVIVISGPSVSGGWKTSLSTLSEAILELADDTGIPCSGSGSLDTRAA